LIVHLVDDGREDLLARTVPVADRHPHDLALLVLVALVAESDRGGLPPLAKLVDEERRVEVEREHANLRTGH